MKYVIKIVSIIFLSLIFVSMRGESAYAAEASSINVKYQAHVQRIGWQAQVKDSNMAGTTGRALRLEALKINVDTSYSNVKIKYRTHVQRRGWLPYVYNGQVSGTTGQELRVEAIQIKLEGAPEGYHIQYQVHVQGKEWTSWVQDGQVAGTTGQYRRLEAIRIKVVKSSPKLDINYQAHVQRIGWQSQVKNNSIAGTTGKALRLEALKINVDTSYSNVKIKYRTHVQRRGWLPYVYNGQVSGTTGHGLRVEAIQIKLEGAPEGYHVQYQVHIQGKGWTSWVQDGQVAGTIGQYRRLEAVRIKISEESLKMKTIVLDAGHGGSDPGAIGNGYKEKDLNMQVIQKLGTKLKALGFNVLYTRQPGKDVYVSLQGRAKYANDKNADLFLSIHHDSSTSGSASGTSTHYSSFRPGVETSGAYVTIKGKRYSVIKEVDGIIYYKDGTATKTVSVNDATAYDATPSEAAKKSEELAKELVDVLSDLGVADRGSRDHNLYVTRWTKMPSVLVEMGFVSNKSEIKKIASSAYQDKAAQKMADIIYKFFNK